MKNKITYFCSNLFLSVVVSLFFITAGKAQEVKIYELFDDVSPVKEVQLSKTSKTTKSTSTVVNAPNSENLNYFYDLNYNLKPTIYIVNNKVVKVPNNQTPIKIKLEDTHSFNVLKSSNPIFEKVELIEINVESVGDLNTVFDISSLQNFNNLKYISIQCNQFSTSVNQIQSFVINVGADLTVYFMTTNPS